MSAERVKKAVAWVLTVAGLFGALLSGFRLIFPDEPFLVVQLSWAAFWTTGIVGVIAADDSGLSDADVERVAGAVARRLR